MEAGVCHFCSICSATFSDALSLSRHKLQNHFHETQPLKKTAKKKSLRNNTFLYQKCAKVITKEMAEELRLKRGKTKMFYDRRTFLDRDQESDLTNQNLLLESESQLDTQGETTRNSKTASTGSTFGMSITSKTGNSSSSKAETTLKVRVEKFFENRKLGGSVDGEGWSDADHQDETYHFSTHFLARAFGFEDNDDVSASGDESEMKYSDLEIKEEPLSPSSSFENCSGDHEASIGDDDEGGISIKDEMPEDETSTEVFRSANVTCKSVRPLLKLKQASELFGKANEINSMTGLPDIVANNKTKPKPVPLTSIKGFTHFARIKSGLNSHSKLVKTSLSPTKNEDTIIVPVLANNEKHDDDITVQRSDDKNTEDVSLGQACYLPENVNTGASSSVVEASNDSGTSAATTMKTSSSTTAGGLCDTSCVFCSSAFGSDHELYTHANEQHRKLVLKSWIKCEMCTHYFPNNVQLNRHKVRNHYHQMKSMQRRGNTYYNSARWINYRK